MNGCPLQCISEVGHKFQQFKGRNYLLCYSNNDKMSLRCLQDISCDQQDEDHIILFICIQLQCTSPAQLPQVLFIKKKTKPSEVATRIEGIYHPHKTRRFVAVHIILVLALE